MQRIWAKIVIDHKVKSNIIHDCGERVGGHNFYDNIVAICDSLKIPTPVVLDTYVRNFLEYGFLKLKQRDFVEDIKFDCLCLESAE